MRSTDALPTSRLHAAIALLAAVWMLTVFVDSGLLWSETSTPHHPHVAATPHGGNLATLIDHPHIGNDSTPPPRDTVIATLPFRTTTALISLGLIAALVAAAAVLTRIVVPVMRGPPRPGAAVSTGRHLTTRFCIARR